MTTELLHSSTATADSTKPKPLPFFASASNTSDISNELTNAQQTAAEWHGIDLINRLSLLVTDRTSFLESTKKLLKSDQLPLKMSLYEVMDLSTDTKFSSYVLSKMPGRLGEFIAATGMFLNLYDCKQLRLNVSLDQTAPELAKDNLKTPNLTPHSTLLDYQGEIDAVFCAPTVEQIYHNLMTAKSEFGRATYETVKAHKHGLSQDRLDAIRRFRGIKASDLSNLRQSHSPNSQ